MNKSEFKQFCKKVFEGYGFHRIRNVFYLSGKEILCVIDLQKSNFGDYYYVNYSYCIGDYRNQNVYPTRNDIDIIGGRIIAMSKTQTMQGGGHFRTSQIEYEEYTEDELSPYFDREIKENILPVLAGGKKYIIDNLSKLYCLVNPRKKEEVMRKLLE